MDDKKKRDMIAAKKSKSVMKINKKINGGKLLHDYAATVSDKLSTCCASVVSFSIT